MTVTRRDPETIVLAGACPVDDAEPLLQMLLETPAAAVDWRACQSLHTAVVQVILAAGACAGRAMRRRLDRKVARAGTRDRSRLSGRNRDVPPERCTAGRSALYTGRRFRSFTPQSSIRETA